MIQHNLVLTMESKQGIQMRLGSYNLSNLCRLRQALESPELKEVASLFSEHFEWLERRLEEHSDMLFGKDDLAQHWKLIGGKELCRNEKGFFEWLLGEVKKAEVKAEQERNKL